MERVKILDQDNFSALVRVKAGLFKLKMYLIGEIVEVSPPKSLVVIIKLKSMCAIIQLSQRVIFLLSSVDEGNTEVTCQVVMEKIAPFFFTILLRWIRAMAEDTLHGIKAYLGQLS